MNPDDLRRSLSDAVPPAPDPAGWADAAVRRSRRATTTRLGFAAVAAVAVVAVPLSQLATSSGQNRVAVPAATTATTPTADRASTGAPTPAPSAARTTGSGGSTASDPCLQIGTVPEPGTWISIPDGAVGVVACDLGFPSRMAGHTGGPPADQVRDVARVLALLGAAPSTTPEPSADRTCPADAGPSFALVFSYPDGRRVAVGGDTAGCADVGGRPGVGRQFRDQYAAIVRDQRAAQTVGTKVPMIPLCPAGRDSSLVAPWLPVDLSRTTRALACPPVGDGPQVAMGYPQRWIAGWPALAARLAANKPTEPGVITLTGPESIIVAADEAGGTMRLTWAGDWLLWRPDVGDPGQLRGYRLTPAEKATVTAAFAR